jgi:hypothetical protein
MLFEKMRPVDESVVVPVLVLPVVTDVKVGVSEKLKVTVPVSVESATPRLELEETSVTLPSAPTL